MCRILRHVLRLRSTLCASTTRGRKGEIKLNMLNKGRIGSFRGADKQGGGPPAAKRYFVMDQAEADELFQSQVDALGAYVVTKETSDLRLAEALRIAWRASLMRLAAGSVGAVSKKRRALEQQ